MVRRLRQRLRDEFEHFYSGSHYDDDDRRMAESACRACAIEVEITGPTNLLQRCLDAGADIFDEGKPLMTLMSPLHQLTLPIDQRDNMEVPRQARYYSFFYPCAVAPWDPNPTVRGCARSLRQVERRDRVSLH